MLFSVHFVTKCCFQHTETTLMICLVALLRMGPASCQLAGTEHASGISSFEHQPMFKASCVSTCLSSASCQRVPIGCACTAITTVMACPLRPWHQMRSVFETCLLTASLYFLTNVFVEMFSFYLQGLYNQTWSQQMVQGHTHPTTRPL